jgi:coenzyme F420-0:L-glutamate ligase/coenzyme F420-1:gamma-L-glutamate ligase
MMAKAMTLTALPGIPRIRQGDDLVAIIDAALSAAGIVMASGDILVVAQKIVSKAEGRVVRLSTIAPSARALALGAEIGKDPRIVQVVLDESEDVIRHRQGGLIIVAHRLGYVMANAGVDQSNLEGDEETVLLLPEDPDASCARLKARLDAAHGVEVAVVISDSFGRPWRNGAVGVALGAAGLPSLVNLVGKPDLAGRPLRVTEVAVGDQVASAASLLMGEADEGLPVVHIRGFRSSAPATNGASLIRSRAMDMFR